MVEIVGIRFKKAGKMYYFDPDGLQLKQGSQVIVETARGVECGTVIKENTFVPEETIIPPLKKVQRQATEQDLEIEEKNKIRGEEAELSSADSRVKIYTIPTNEELMIARETLKLCQS